jgi:flagellar biosynthesis protein FlhG
MSEDDARSSPRTLADVSHLFFSRTEEQGTSAEDADIRPGGDPDGRGPADVRESEHPGASADARGPLFIVVTGGSDAPGKSTVAVNIAQALLPLGRAALFDADPGIPSARFYLRMPSWNYLSPLTGDGTPVPDAVTDSGLLVRDWTADEPEASAPAESDGSESQGGRSLDYIVVDVPSSGSTVMERAMTHRACFVVVACPGEEGFMSAFAALRALPPAVREMRVGLIVNRAPDEEYARAFHAKIAEAAERLLSMSVVFLGNIPFEAAMAVVQRERGAVVASRPDSGAALSLREIATGVVSLAEERAT